MAEGTGPLKKGGVKIYKEKIHGISDIHNNKSLLLQFKMKGLPKLMTVAVQQRIIGNH